MEQSGAEVETGWRRLLDWLWLLAWGVASSVWCVTAAGQLGATFDEPFYVRHGLDHWRTGSYAGLMKLGTMPLPVDATTLPLYLWERWQGTSFDPDGDLERLLPVARLGTLLFWWLLLIYGRLAGRQLAGPWGGRLAVALLACEPSLLAHAGLATTDIALTACVLALVYHFRTGRTAGWPRRVGLPAFWFGAAVLAKASALAFGPLCLLAVELERLWRERAASWSRDAERSVGGPRSALASWLHELRPLRRDAVQILAIGFALAFVYIGSDWRPQASFVKWAHKLPEGTTGRSMVWVAENLRVFPNAGEGLVRQMRHNVHGHGCYLLGQAHARAMWYYFPVLFTIKLSVPLLLLPLVLLAVRWRSLLNWAVAAAAVLLVFSLTCRVQIGIRLLLPLVVLAVIGLTAALVQTCQAAGPGWRRRLLVGVAAGCVGWTGWAALDVWPHGLCYTNELWGGTERGYLLVSDANYDWGQGMKELARWQQEQGVSNLDVWYFGSDPMYKRLPVRLLPLHILPIRRPEDVLAHVRGRYLAVSTTVLYGGLLDGEAQRQAVAFLRARQPVARTTTFLIYDFTSEPAE
jgi:hypothetical protein